MHLERGRINQETRPDELIVHVVIAQDVANILAKKALDAFPKFLDAIDVLPAASARCRPAHRAAAA